MKGLSMKRKTLGIAVSPLLAVAVPAMAHHSFAMFESTKTITLTGAVKQFEWVNPHSWIHIMVLNAAGKPEEWAFEMGTPGQLASRGWKRDSVKTGDMITVVAHPMKDDSHGGSEMMVKLADGTVLGGIQQPAPGGALSPAAN
jgi:hypothetical protein